MILPTHVNFPLDIDASAAKNPHLSGIETKSLGSFLEIILKGGGINFSKETAIQALQGLPNASQTYKQLFVSLNEKIPKKAWRKPFISGVYTASHLLRRFKFTYNTMFYIAIMDNISRTRLDQLDRETFRVGHALLKEFTESVNLVSIYFLGIFVRLTVEM